MARFSECRFCVASTAFLVAVSLCLAFAPAAYKHAPDCEACEAFRLRNVELERQLRECAASNDLRLRDQPVPSGEHLLVGSNQYSLTGATILPCARRMQTLRAFRIHSWAGKEHDVQATDVPPWVRPEPLKDSSVQAGDGMGSLLSRATSVSCAPPPQGMRLCRWGGSLVGESAAPAVRGRCAGLRQAATCCSTAHTSPGVLRSPTSGIIRFVPALPC